MAHNQEHEDIHAAFSQAVNMSEAELKDYLGTDESRDVAWKGGQGGAGGGEHEVAGHEMARHIVELLGTKHEDLRDPDFATMKKVTGYIQRHLSQKPGDDIAESSWRYSLMNWGHDPLKD